MATNNNVCFELIPDVKEICDQFMREINLHFFGFLTAYEDGRYYFLDSDSAWPENGFIENEIPPACFPYFDQITNKISYPTMEKGDFYGWPDEYVKISRERFNIKNPMIIFKKISDHYQFYLFDLHEPHVYDIYENNRDFFERFIFYFKDSADHLITKASQNYMRVSEKYLSQKNKNVVNQNKLSETLISNAPKPHRYILNLENENRNVSITPREYQCLELLAVGKSMKVIANELGLSQSTVQNHIFSMREKLRAPSAKSAIDIYWKNRYS